MTPNTENSSRKKLIIAAVATALTVATGITLGAALGVVGSPAATATSAEGGAVASSVEQQPSNISANAPANDTVWDQAEPREQTHREREHHSRRGEREHDEENEHGEDDDD